MWYWKFHKQLQLDTFPVRDGHFQVLPNGNLEAWENSPISYGKITEIYPNVDGSCVSTKTIFAGYGTGYFHQGPGIHTNSYYEAYNYFVGGTRYYNITRKDTNGNILGNVRYHTNATYMDTARIIEINHTHIVWLLNWGSLAVPYPNDTWAIVLPIPSSTTIVSYPMTTLTLNPDVLTKAENLVAFHQPPYHELQYFSANLNKFYADTSSKDIISVGTTYSWADDLGIPLTHNKTDYANNWAIISSYDTPTGTYDQYVTNMEKSLVSNTIQYEWTETIDIGLISETQFARSELQLTSPYTDSTFPVLAFGRSLEFLVPTAQGVYSFMNPVSQYNTAACELWSYYQYDKGLGSYQFGEAGYALWYINPTNIYVMTMDSDNDTDDTFGFRIWKYVGIGKASVGPHQSSSFRLPGSYYNNR